MADEQQTVTVQAIKLHTHEGHAYHPGDTYELDADLVASLTAQGMAVPVHQPSAQPRKASHPVTPMSAEDFPTPKKHAKG